MPKSVTATLLEDAYDKVLWPHRGASMSEPLYQRAVALASRSLNRFTGTLSSTL